LSDTATREKIGKWKRGLRYFSVRSPFSSWCIYNSVDRFSVKGYEIELGVNEKTLQIQRFPIAVRSRLKIHSLAHYFISLTTLTQLSYSLRSVRYASIPRSSTNLKPFRFYKQNYQTSVW
jgi:hypothetical protein